MSKKNKILAMLLAMLMLLSLLAACTGDNDGGNTNNPGSGNTSNPGGSVEPINPDEIDTSEHVVLTMYCIGDEGGIYADQHLEKLNQILTEKINAEIKPIMGA